MEKVTPNAIQANGFYNHFSGMKKWTITCDRCNHTWVEKVPIVEPSSVVCPCCCTQNIWSIVKFEKEYNKVNN